MSPSFVIAYYVVSVLICTAVAVYAMSRKRTAGAVPFAVSASGQAFWTLGHLFENLSPTLGEKIFWDDLQFLGTTAWAVGFSAFARAYTKTERPRSAQLAVNGFIGAYLVLVFTDRFHHLIRPVATLTHDTPFGELVYPFTAPTLIASVVLFAMLGDAVVLLARQFRGAHAIFRKQLAFIVAGALLPLTGTLLTLLGVRFGADRDTSPTTFALGDVLAAWGLFRYGFLDLIPIAREVVVEHLRDSVVVLDARDRIVDMNPASLAALGLDAESAIGKPATEVFSQYANLFARFGGGGNMHVDLSVDVLGQARDFDLTMTPISDSAGAQVGRVFISHDVTRLRQIERELGARNEELEAAYRDLDAFTHSVSHDLRAPLRTIEGFSDLLLRTQKGRLDEQGEEHLALLVQGTRRMRQLFEDLLRFARLGREPILRRDVSPDDLVDAVLADFGAEIASRGVRIVRSPLPRCVGDPSLLKQVYLNLVGNALKYSRGKPNATIEIFAEETPGGPRYVVRDDGVGFDVRQRERLFRVFSRLHDPERFEGSGVGLAIVASIVQRHGGTVAADSAPGGGATFSFSLGSSGEDPDEKPRKEYTAPRADGT